MADEEFEASLGQAVTDLGESLRPGGIWRVDALNATTALGSAFGSWQTSNINVRLEEIPENGFAEILVDPQRRAHSVDNRPAIKYSDGREEYYWHGVAVPAFVILEPQKITVEAIEVAGNAEVRRVMIEKYGLPRYIQDCGARLIAKDETGELYRKNWRGAEPLTMVKVINSTPEPDGSFKPYFLRVPPTVKTAKEAVAWTFRMTPKEYDVALQT